MPNDGETTFITMKIGTRIWVDMVDFYNVMITDHDNWYKRFYDAMNEHYVSDAREKESDAK
jgi:hypothetical protein